MAEDLQGLLSRINEEGLKKTETEKEQILSAARQQAEATVEDARKKAEGIVNDAKAEQQQLIASGEARLQQAARDVVVSLEQELAARLEALVKACVAATMDQEFLAELVLKVAEEYGRKQGRVARVELLLPADELAELEEFFKGKLGEEFAEGVTFRPIEGIDAGLQVSFDGESVYHDFSDDAVRDLLCAYLSPKFTALLAQDEE